MALEAVAGVLLGALLLVYTRPRSGRRGAGTQARGTQALGGWVLGLGLAGALAFIAALALASGGAGVTNPVLWLGSVVLGMAALVAGAGALVRGERTWAVVVGLFGALMVAYYWAAYIASRWFGLGG